MRELATVSMPKFEHLSPVTTGPEVYTVVRRSQARPWLPAEIIGQLQEPADGQTIHHRFVEDLIPDDDRLLIPEIRTNHEIDEYYSPRQFIAALMDPDTRKVRRRFDAYRTCYSQYRKHTFSWDDNDEPGVWHEVTLFARSNLHKEHELTALRWLSDSQEQELVLKRRGYWAAAEAPHETRIAHYYCHLISRLVASVRDDSLLW